MQTPGSQTLHPHLVSGALWMGWAGLQELGKAQDSDALDPAAPHLPNTAATSSCFVVGTNKRECCFLLSHPPCFHSGVTTKTPPGPLLLSMRTGHLFQPASNLPPQHLRDGTLPALLRLHGEEEHGEEAARPAGAACSCLHL
jgi:hypothetical protein